MGGNWTLPHGLALFVDGKQYTKQKQKHNRDKTYMLSAIFGNDGVDLDIPFCRLEIKIHDFDVEVLYDHTLAYTDGSKLLSI